ncbi:MAG: hypothetical protein B6D46_11030 [Polyangiaceae bacterium UTPRO1]|nr:MAG: hypothetical protein B6D46_11030 [Polyangiaceae bacterium UTPRO1]
MSASGAFPSSTFLAAVRNTTLTMAASHAKRLTDVLACHEAPSAKARSEALAVAPVPAFRHAATAILDAWATEPDVLGTVLAAALLAAVYTAEAVRTTQALDVI